MGRLTYTFDCMTPKDAKLVLANKAGILAARNELKQVFLELCKQGVYTHFWIDRSALTGWVQILYPKQASRHFYSYLIQKFTSEEADRSPPAPDREEYSSAAA